MCQLNMIARTCIWVPGLQMPLFIVKQERNKITVLARRHAGSFGRRTSAEKQIHESGLFLDNLAKKTIFLHAIHILR